MIQADNFNELYQKLIKHTLDNGKKYSPRGIEVIEVIGSQFELTNPLNCLCTLKSRKINPKFAIIEKMEYMSGESNPERICWYNKNYSTWLNEETGQFDGAYGPRIKTQLPWIYKLLKKDKDSRQAVITIRNFEDCHETKDHPCFTAGTLIHSPENNITIGRLTRKFESGEINKYPIFTLNEKTKEIEINYCRKAFEKSKKEHVVEIKFDVGKVQCTPDHLFLIKKRIKTKNNKKHGTTIVYNWVKAKDLKENDYIVPIRYIKSDKSLAFIKDIKGNWSYKNQVKIQQEYCNFLKDNCDNKEVHHINLNPYDNSYRNLLVVSKEKHRAIHQVINNSNTKVYKNLKERNKYKNKNIDKFISENKVNKVISVKKQHRLYDVYDLIVDNNHNFFVNSGVCVHNCTLSLQFLIRDNKLNLIATMRSNDLLWGTPYDVNGFCFLQEVLASWLEIEVGTYIHQAGSLHIYTERIEQYKKVLESNETFNWVNPKFDLNYEDTQQFNINFWHLEKEYREENKVNDCIVFGKSANLNTYYKVITSQK